MKMSFVAGEQSGADQTQKDGGTMPVTSAGAGVGDLIAELFKAIAKSPPTKRR